MVRFINVKHIDVVVPTPWVMNRGFRVLINEARAVFLQQTHHGSASGTAIEPDGERRIFGIMTSLKEPEEAVFRQ